MAAAIQEMLRHNPKTGRPYDTPLFRDTETGLEITYAKGPALFKRALTQAGFPEMATGLHNLRAGGSTAYANADECGLLVATAMEAGSATLIACTIGRARSA